MKTVGPTEYTPLTLIDSTWLGFDEAQCRSTQKRYSATFDAVCKQVALTVALPSCMVLVSFLKWN